MNIKTIKTELKRVSTYAREKKVSVQTIYNQINNGTLKSVKIDGVTFVEIEKEDENRID
jgi:hypothetical protein